MLAILGLNVQDGLVLFLERNFEWVKIRRGDANLMRQIAMGARHLILQEELEEEDPFYPDIDEDEYPVVIGEDLGSSVCHSEEEQDLADLAEGSQSLDRLPLVVEPTSVTSEDDPDDVFDVICKENRLYDEAWLGAAGEAAESVEEPAAISTALCGVSPWPTVD